MNKSRQQHSIFWPIVLIAAGIIFLLSNIGVLSSGVGELLGTYWPLILLPPVWMEFSSGKAGLDPSS